ncbi:sugar ABC transporter substrate-binding protein [Domibacillus sp. 8LH]|uniref:sugar ABC transporter substrate-binding protein n=1 Tax=Domibacillus sp. 8LH TaxID=3073900 RepID=UPI003177D01A
MKKSRKWLAAMGFLFILLLAGCSKEAGGPEDKAEDHKVIGVSMANFSDQYVTYMLDAMKEEEKKHSSVEFIYTDAQDDSSTQMSQIENFISRDVDTIIFSPVDTVAAEGMLDTINAASIPSIVLLKTFDGVEKATAYVGSESMQAGIIQMEEAAKMLGGKGNIAILMGPLGHEAQVKRTEGNKQVIDKKPKMKVVLEGAADYDREKGMTLMENWLQTNKKIDAVIANNDEMAIGAIMAIEAAGKLDDILVAGIDATPPALEYVQEGKMELTVFQDAIGQGTSAIQTAVKTANGEKVEKNILIPFELVTKENAAKYAEKWK